MFDNKKFESQVRQKLQELDFSPSASVWDKIEAQLPSENSRRAIPIFWRIFMTAAAVAAGGYFFLTNKTESHKVNNSTLTINAPIIASGNNNTIVKEDNKLPGSSETAVMENDYSKTLTDSHQAVAGSNEMELAENTSGHSSRPSEGNIRSVKRRNLPATRLLLLNNEGAESEPTAESVSGKMYLTDESVHEVIAKPSIVDGNIAYHDGFKVDASVKQLDALAATPARLKSNKKWSFELNFSGGQSIYSDGKVKKLFTSAQPTILNNQFVPPGTNLYAAPPKPSDIKPGNSFSAGINTRYRISHAFSVTGGISYRLLTTKINTGAQSGTQATVGINGMSRQVANYYNAGYVNDYTNKYHFIEIPVLAHYQFNKGKKLPLFVHGGVSFAKLVKTNALHFDGSANIYYKANELVKKNFVNIEGGVSAKLFSSRKFSVIIGPEIQYGMTNLFTGKVPQNNKHSLFIGLKAAVPLPI